MTTPPERMPAITKRKWRSLFMAPVLAASASVPVALNPPTVEAAWNGIIMPGRVLRDHPAPTSACRATAYGRVDSNLVLFLADHCRDPLNGDVHYGPAYTNGGAQIGWWGNPGTSWENNDLTYITLDVNSVYYPTSGRNKVYKGNVPGPDDYWYMTTQPGQFDGCDGFPAGGAYPDTSYRLWQRYMTTTYQYETGHVTGLTFEGQVDHCVVFTDFGEHPWCCESGTPIIRYSDQTTLNGLFSIYNDYAPAADEGTKSKYGSNGELAVAFQPLYEGLEDLDTFWDNNGNHTGAKLCISSSCPV